MGSRKKSARSEEGGFARILFSHGLKFGSDTQLAEPCREGLAHHAIRFQNIFPPCGDGSRSNDTVGQVAVVQDRLAAGWAAHDGNTTPAAGFQVDFLAGLLKASQG